MEAMKWFNLKKVVNLMNEQELKALTSIKYEDEDTLEMIFELDGNCSRKYNTIKLLYNNKDDFSISMYSTWEDEKTYYVDQNVYYFISKVINKLNLIYETYES